MSSRGIRDRRQAVLRAGFAVVSVVLLTAQASLAGAAPSGRTQEMPGSMVVRGSVGQIHVIDAPQEVDVSVRGPRGFRATGTTDHLGGLILRDVPAGNGYTVRVEGQRGAVARVRVLAPDDHPDADFYAAQQLPPDRGYIETRDGTLLAYHVQLPDVAEHGPGPYDVVVSYSGYQPEDSWVIRPLEEFSNLGYAAVKVAMRGSGCSGGAFDLMEPLTWLDGYDFVEAFAAQDWVDDVALGDQSWPGLSQFYVASTQPPSLDAIVPGAPVGDFYRDVFFPGGIENVGFGRIWGAGRDAENAFPSSRAEVNERIANDPICAANQSLRGQNQSIVEAQAAHPFDDDYWETRNAELRVGDITVPTLQIVSWQDPQVGGRPATLLDRYAEDTPVRFIGTNGFHTYFDGDVWDEIVRFLSVYLGDDPAAVATYEAEDPVTILLEKNDPGVARGRFGLPHLNGAGDGQRWSLGGELVAEEPDADGAASTFTYDASAYAGTGFGEAIWSAPRQDEARFVSAPLTEDVVMVGSASADLWVNVAAPDVDLQVTITEVRPDGQEMLVQSGWLRASHRALDEAESTIRLPRHFHLESSVSNLEPGTPTLVRVEVFPFAHAFRAGSSIRIIIGGPGGGGNFWPWDFGVLPGGFDVSVLHDPAHQSTVVLPVLNQPIELPVGLPTCGQLSWQPCRAFSGVLPE